MKKYKSLFAVLVALICAVVVTSCEDPLPKSVPVNSVNLSTSAVELTEGDSYTLTATILPSDADNKNVTWTSSNAEVASVTNGKVTAHKPGTSTITVTTEDGSKSASCVMTVVYGNNSGNNESVDENNGLW